MTKKEEELFLKQVKKLVEENPDIELTLSKL
jgi:hypothetical protein